jgi:hypothetical protein
MVVDTFMLKEVLKPSGMQYPVNWRIVVDAADEFAV